MWLNAHRHLIHVAECTSTLDTVSTQAPPPSSSPPSPLPAPPPWPAVLPSPACWPAAPPPAAPPAVALCGPWPAAVRLHHGLPCVQQPQTHAAPWPGPWPAARISRSAHEWTAAGGGEEGGSKAGAGEVGGQQLGGGGGKGQERGESRVGLGCAGCGLHSLVACVVVYVMGRVVVYVVGKGGCVCGGKGGCVCGGKGGLPRPQPQSGPPQVHRSAHSRKNQHGFLALDPSQSHHGSLALP